MDVMRCVDAEENAIPEVYIWLFIWLVDRGRIAKEKDGISSSANILPERIKSLRYQSEGRQREYW